MYDDIDQMYEDYMNSLIEEQEDEQVKVLVKPPAGLSKKELKNWYQANLGYLPHKWLQDYKQAKKALKKAQVPMSTCSLYIPSVSLSCFDETQTVSYATMITESTGTYPEVRGVPCKQKEKDTTMTHLYETGSEPKNYLFKRLDAAAVQKKDDLKRTFGLVDDAAPATLTELIARIQAGNIVLPHDADNKDRWAYTDDGYMIRQVRYRDPAKVEDKDGYSVASDKVNAAKKTVEDTIVVMDAPSGLKALQDFEATSFSA